MANVGILTFCNTVNYGASLQAYALRATIERLGASCDVINYSNEVLDAREQGMRFSLNPAQAMRWMLRRGFERKREEAFAQFSCNRLSLTERMGRRDLPALGNRYDCIVVGSDQVWNPRVNGNDPAFFGRGFSRDTRMVSYAASLGDATAESIRSCDSEAPALLSRFAGVSVRERSSVETLGSMGIAAQCCIDPSFLLTRDAWNSLAAESKFERPSRPYVFVYTLNGEDLLLDAARRAAAAEGLEVLCLHYNTKDFKGVRNIRAITPEDFVALLAGARCVFADSFHGVCFSINLNRPFVVKLSGAKVQSNVRIIDILDRYGLSACKLDDAFDAMPSIDFIEVNRRLDEDRRAAIAYLASHIGLERDGE